MKLRVLALVFAFATWLSIDPAGAEAPPPSLDGPEWARGPHSAMHMLLEKTLLGVDVLTVDVRVGKPVHRRFVEVIGNNKRYSEKLGADLAAVALEADEALVQVRYLRKVSFAQWLEGVTENLDRAEAAKLITPEMKRRVLGRLPLIFASLKERGYENGDRLLYRVRPSAVRMVVVSEKGTVYVDRTDAGKDPPRIVMASYFAPEGDFREPLLRSLFD
jgi:hypothetical protein